MIPIIFLTETQLEPAEVKWMHGVRMREIFGIDVLRQLKGHLVTTPRERWHRCAATCGTPGSPWPPGAGSFVSWLRDALGTSRLATQGQAERLRFGPKSSIMELSSVLRCSNAPNVT
eukprot:scaffold94388_cov21-Phaeocystis_antarctica.AAC.1